MKASIRSVTSFTPWARKDSSWYSAAARVPMSGRWLTWPLTSVSCPCTPYPQIKQLQTGSLWLMPTQMQAPAEPAVHQSGWQLVILLAPQMLSPSLGSDH